MDEAAFKSLIDPAVVAVVGASTPERGYAGGRAFCNLLSGGRRVHPVNPRLAGTELLGRTVYPSVMDLPDVPDLTVIATPARTVPSILVEVGQRGGRAAVVFSAPVGRDAPDEASFDRSVREIAKTYDIAIVGANCQGILSVRNRLAANFLSSLQDPIFAEDAVGPGLREGGLALLSQSGGGVSYLLSTFVESPIGYSHLISTGSEAVVSLASLLEHLVKDEATRTVVLFLEGVSDGARFRRALVRARELGKHVVVLKVGRTTAGRSAVQSHTGRMAGDEETFTALLDELRIPETTSFQDALDFAYRFEMTPWRGVTGTPRMAVVSQSGYAGGLAADALSAGGWVLPAPSRETRQALLSVGGDEHLRNPFDILGAFVHTDRLARYVEVLAASGEYDEVMVATGSNPAVATDMARHIADVVRGGVATPVTVGWTGIPERARQVLEAGGVSVFPDLVRAVRASSAHVRSCVSDVDVERMRRLGRMLDGGVEVTGPVLSGSSAAGVFEVLSRWGVTCAPFDVVGGDASWDEVCGAAHRVGFPLVLKVESDLPLHKSDVGGVIIDIRSLAELERAWRELRGVMERVDTSGRLLVQRMVSGVEVFVGARWDASFGHVLVLGLGGVFAELFDDVQAAVLPTQRWRLEELVSGHERLGRLLDGFRGAPGGDRKALVELLDGVASWLSVEGERVRELDLNPVIVDLEGAFVVDARAITEADVDPGQAVVDA